MSRVVAITGAGTETAVAAARLFAERGAALALLSRTPEGLDRATAGLDGRDGRVLALVVDTADPDAIEGAADRIEDELGPVDVWVTTADDPDPAPFEDLCPSELRRVTDLLYLGQVHTALMAIERMRDGAGGTVVHVTSPLARHGRAGRAAASGARAALRGFHEAVAAELRADDSPVRSVLVEHPEGASAESVARSVVHAAHPHHLRTQLVRAGVVGTGAAVAAGTAVFVRRRRR